MFHKYTLDLQKGMVRNICHTQPQLLRRVRSPHGVAGRGAAHLSHLHQVGNRLQVVDCQHKGLQSFSRRHVSGLEPHLQELQDPGIADFNDRVQKPASGTVRDKGEKRINPQSPFARYRLRCLVQLHLG